MAQWKMENVTKVVNKNIVLLYESSQSRDKTNRE